MPQITVPGLRDAVGLTPLVVHIQAASSQLSSPVSPNLSDAHRFRISPRPHTLPVHHRMHLKRERLLRIVESINHCPCPYEKHEKGAPDESNEEQEHYKGRTDWVVSKRPVYHPL